MLDKNSGFFCQKAEKVMDCLLFEGKEAVSPSDRDALERHLLVCAECREYFSDLKKLKDVFDVREEPVVPPESLERIRQGVRNRIAAAERERAVIEKVIRQKAKRRTNQKLQPKTVFRLQKYSLAALLYIASAALTYFSVSCLVHEEPSLDNSRTLFGLTDNAGRQDRPGNALDVQEIDIQKLKKDFSACTFGKDKIKLLTKTFETSTQNCDFEAIREVINLAKGFAKKNYNKRNGLHALKLVSECHEMLGEFEPFKAAYLEYADAFGQYIEEGSLRRGMSQESSARDGEGKCRELVLAKAKTIFDQKDYLHAISFFDFIRTRFPESNEARESAYLMACFYDRSRSYEHAVEEYKKILASNPYTETARKARAALPSSLFNGKRQSDAIQMCLDNSEMAGDKETKASCLNSASLFYLALGGPSIADASQLMKRVEKEYPDTVYASMSKDMQKKLNSRISKEIDGITDDLIDL